MSRSKFLIVLASLLAALCTSGTSYSQGKKRRRRPAGDRKDKDKKDKDKDSVPGKRWEYTAKKGGQEIEAGTFRAENHKIFRGAEQIGTYSSAGPGELKLQIDKGELKGAIDLKLLRIDPRPVYAGEWEMAAGGKANIQVRFLED